MKQHTLLRGILTCIAGLVLIFIISACAGVPGTTGSGNSVSITGTIQSVDTVNDTVTLSVQGQTLTIKGLNTTQLSAIKSQAGHVYTITATQNSDGSYTITTGSTPINDNTTQTVTQGIVTTTTNDGTPDTNTPEPGSIAFIGKVQSVSNSALVVAMPNGQNLSMSIVNGQTDIKDFNGSLPTVGQLLKVEASTNTDGSFMATKLSTADSGNLQDQNLVTYKGLTTSAVGTDNVLHLKVGNQSLTFTISSSADLGDFNNNAQSISSNQSIKVDVLYQGSSSLVQKVSN